MRRTSLTLGLILAATAGCDGGTRSGGGGGADSGGGSGDGGGGGTDSGGGDLDGGGGGTDSGDRTDSGGGGTDSGGTDSGGSGTDSGGGGMIVLPPVNGGLDYQLGGAYAPPSGVTIVSRDRTESPASGLYNICYVNGFQIQPGEEDFWMREHPDLILRDGSGAPVIDAGWDEMLIDVSTPAKRAGVAMVVGEWIRGCASDGFDAVEIDNLDSYSRSRGLISQDDAVAQVRLFADAAHAVGLAIAQKNSTDIVDRRAEMGTDFLVSEDCNTYSECDVYIGAYGEHVLMIEYERGDFDTGCRDYPGYSVVLRDLNLTTPSSGAYVYDGC